MGGGRLSRSSTSEPLPETIGELFEKCAPYYLSLGMTLQEYWCGEPKLAQYYLSAFNIKQKRDLENQNFTAWLQGLYFENAAYSAIANTLDGKEAKKKGISYMEKPIDISNSEKSKEDEVHRAQQQCLDWMIAMDTALKKKFGGD